MWNNEEYETRRVFVHSMRWWLWGPFTASIGPSEGAGEVHQSWSTLLCAVPAGLGLTWAWFYLIESTPRACCPLCWIAGPIWAQIEQWTDPHGLFVWSFLITTKLELLNFNLDPFGLPNLDLRPLPLIGPWTDQKTFDWSNLSKLSRACAADLLARARVLRKIFPLII